MQKKKCQPQALYPAKLSFEMEGEIKTFPIKQRPALQEILKEILWFESVTDGNLNPQEETKNYGNGKYKRWYIYIYICVYIYVCVYCIYIYTHFLNFFKRYKTI